MKPLIYILIALSILAVSDYAISAYVDVQNYDFSYVESFERTVEEEPPVEVHNEIDEAMLNWVIMCESSGRHEGIWGAEDEYGILQWKIETWDWLSEVLDYEGDWQNQEDQIEFFLIAVEAGYGNHWSCWRKYKNL